MKITQNKNDYCDLDALRRLVKAFDNLNESFNQRFSVVGLISIYNAWQTCGVEPTEWSDDQLKDVLNFGICPHFE